MTSRIPIFAVSALSMAVLAACNLKGNYAPPPEGYANATTDVGNGGYFSRQTAKRIVLVNGVRSFKDQNVRVDLAADGQTAKIFVNNTTYNLTVDPGDPNLFTGSFAYGIVGYNSSSDVQIIYFSYDDNGSTSVGYENRGQFVVGFKTDPIEVRDRIGTATYSGAAVADFYVGNLGETGIGTMNLTADFSAASIHGTINLVDAVPGSGPNMPNVDITFNPGKSANIAGNAFAGATNTTIHTVGGDTASVSGGALSGHFYGVDAASVGGTFWNTGTFNGQQLLIQGAFANN